MNEATAERLARTLRFNGSAILEDRTSLQRLLAPGATEVPADVHALLVLLDTKAVAHLIKWATTDVPNKPSYEQMRDHIAAKYAQSGKLTAELARWGLDAWAKALPSVQQALRSTPRAMTLEAVEPPPPPPPAAVPAAAAAVAGRPSPAPLRAASPLLAPAAARDNPYAPPESHVDDVYETTPDANFIVEGRAVGIGRGVAWFAEGWRLFASQPFMWWLVLILWLAISMGLQLIPIAGIVLGFLLAPILMAGLMVGADAIRQGESLRVEHLFRGFSQGAGSLMLVALIQLAAVIAIIGLLYVLFGSSMMVILKMASSGRPPSFAMINSLIGLLLVGGFLFSLLSVTYYFSPALVAINGVGAGTAFGRAFTAAFKNVLPGLVFLLVCSVVLAITVALIFVHWIFFLLAWIAIFPMILTTLYSAYYDIFHDADDTARPRSATKSRPFVRKARTLTPASNVPVARAPADR